jgi:DNA-binding transcriptional regulator YdaS (Cro superfamily)
MLTQFIDQNVTAELKSATADTMQSTMAAEAARDKVQADVNAAQGRIDQANAQAEALRQEIDAKKNSDVLAYAQVCRTHAQGDLTAAQNQLNAFLARFPSSSLTDAAKAQLTMVEGELAAQAAQKKEQEADADAATAAAKADFLARASKDGVTLSEARQMILGKTRDEVTSLFGTPTETGSDRWGYERVITINPMTEAKQGLAIYFSEGAVQGVDYYYGSAAGNANAIVK